MRFISFRHGYGSIRQPVRKTVNLSPFKLLRGIESNLPFFFWWLSLRFVFALTGTHIFAQLINLLCHFMC
ncbi:uncharacterized protein ANIA_10246 [Aspergillus nidulans FGSC A4]|uniref:Uncharacterized protein n=1 Tax=Emericella nidulans (strain FGSC A4 / ATCC 38163 / CBS 112.46 / NRRL 194 / M139) TaxID=227321 RepID=C8VKS2_EMENI|nr:hypothetical protein [Aspergillus nidulans FGSC A4]CBF85792.1 TPA: hypothetical protein ANIA_10246 [Aspergillus nidulans FGSC A4]